MRGWRLVTLKIGFDKKFSWKVLKFNRPTFLKVTGTLVWGPSWNWYKLCKPNDQGCKHCPKGHSRVFCHQQPQPYDYDSFDSDKDQPVVCAVCFNGHNFYGPECTTNGKLIKNFKAPLKNFGDEKKKESDKSSPKPEVEASVKKTEGQLTAKAAPEAQAVVPGLRIFSKNQGDKPSSSPGQREADDTSLLWLGIGGLIFCPFVVVIANGVYK